MKQPVIPAFFRLLLSMALAAFLCIPDAARAKSSTETDASHPVPVPEASGDAHPVLSFDYPPDMPLPKDFRLADGGTDPNRPGIALRLSGSSEFDAPGLATLAAALPGPVVVVDLRQESHGFLNGEPVSWFADKDRGNFGKSPDEAALDEKTRLEALRRAGTALVTTIQSKNKDGGIKKSDADTVAVVSVSSEADLAASLGLGYLRLYVTDDMAPDAVQVDRFVDLCRAMAPGTWLHMHCHAGHGRTTTFMVMYALLFNAAGKPLERIAAEQAVLGGSDLLNSPKGGWKRELYLDRAAFLREFAAYAAANPGGAPLSFSQWTASRSFPKSLPVSGRDEFRDAVLTASRHRPVRPASSPAPN